MGLTRGLEPRTLANYPCQMLLLWKESQGLWEAKELNLEVGIGVLLFITGNSFMPVLVINGFIAKDTVGLLLECSNPTVLEHILFVGLEHS